MKKVALSANSMSQVIDGLLKRNPGQYGEYEKTVSDIIANVRTNGDEAVF